MTPCTRWDGRHRKSDGRPMIGKRYAYRVLWEEAFWPLGSEVLHHRCGHAWCVNLDHLEAKSQGDHLIGHGWTGDHHQAQKTHCPAGHAYTPDNTYVYQRTTGPERHCRQCTRDAKARWKARQAA